MVLQWVSEVEGKGEGARRGEGGRWIEREVAREEAGRSDGRFMCVCVCVCVCGNVCIGMWCGG